MESSQTRFGALSLGNRLLLEVIRSDPQTPKLMLICLEIFFEKSRWKSLPQSGVPLSNDLWECVVLDCGYNTQSCPLPSISINLLHWSISLSSWANSSKEWQMSEEGCCLNQCRHKKVGSLISAAWDRWYSQRNIITKIYRRKVQMANIFGVFTRKSFDFQKIYCCQRYCLWNVSC